MRMTWPFANLCCAETARTAQLQRNAKVTSAVSAKWGLKDARVLRSSLFLPYRNYAAISPSTTLVRELHNSERFSRNSLNLKSVVEQVV